MTKQRAIMFLILILILSISCIPAFPSFLLEPTPTPAVLNLPFIRQVIPPRNLLIGGLTWSPDGAQIAVSFYRIPMDLSSAPEFQIQVLDIRDGKMKLIEESKQMSHLRISAVTAWLPDNRIAFYAIGDLQEGTWIMQADGKESKTLVIENIAASWSADGTQIAFWVSKQGSRSSTETIYIRELGSGEQKQAFVVEEAFTTAGVLRWSPNKNKLLFTLGTSATSQEEAFRNINLYVLDITTGNVSRLTQGGSHGDAVWSPEGKLIAYIYLEELNNRVRTSLDIMRADGSCPIRIIGPTDQDFGALSWSPNGDWLAFAWDNGIYLLDTAKVAEIELLKNSSICP